MGLLPRKKGSLLKKIVKPEIVDKFDHSLVLNANSSHAEIDLSAFEKVFLLPYQDNYIWPLVAIKFENKTTETNLV